MMGSSTKLTTQIAVDLHGFHPDEITGWPLEFATSTSI